MFTKCGIRYVGLLEWVMVTQAKQNYSGSVGKFVNDTRKEVGDVQHRGAFL